MVVSSRFEPALSELLDAKDHNLVAHAHEDHDLVADESAIGLEGHAQGKRAEEQPESGICMDSCQGTCARCQVRPQFLATALHKDNCLGYLSSWGFSKALCERCGCQEVC